MCIAKRVRVSHDFDYEFDYGYDCHWRSTAAGAGGLTFALADIFFVMGEHSIEKQKTDDGGFDSNDERAQSIGDGGRRMALVHGGVGDRHRIRTRYPIAAV